MANGEGWARDVVQTTLARREKEGEEGLSIDELQEACGVGRGDLEEALAMLVSEGVVALNESDGGAYEFVPPEERAPAVPIEELDPNDPDRLEAEAAAEEARQPVPGATGAPGVPADRVRELARQGIPGSVLHVGGPVVRLTEGMVNALTDEALGQMVKAAIAEYGGDDELTIAIAK